MDACLSPYGVQLHALLPACVWTKDSETVIKPTDLFHVLGLRPTLESGSMSFGRSGVEMHKHGGPGGEEVNDGGVRASGPSGSTLGPAH